MPPASCAKSGTCWRRAISSAAWSRSRKPSRQIRPAGRHGATVTTVRRIDDRLAALEAAQARRRRAGPAADPAFANLSAAELLQRYRAMVADPPPDPTLDGLSAIELLARFRWLVGATRPIGRHGARY